MSSTISEMNNKKHISVLVTIIAAHTKLPLFFIGKGKTDFVEGSQIGDICYYWKEHTESGWMNDEIFGKYLMHLRKYFNDDAPIHLILEIYKSHLTEDVRKLAETLNIVIYFIPAGMNFKDQKSPKFS